MRTIIKNVRLRGEHDLVQVGIEGERISEVGQSLSGAVDAEWDAGGRLLIPGFVTAHLHLDKCLLGAAIRAKKPQTIQDMMTFTWEHKARYTEEDICARAVQVIETAITNGTTAIRGFADVDTTGGLVGIRALLRLKERYAGELTLQVCAWPQEGIYRDPGCAELMEEAMRLGADVVGGVPSYEFTDATMREHVNFCFELAKRYDRDIHMLPDDSDSPLARSLEYIAVRTIEETYQGRVTTGHCSALSAYDHAHADYVIDLVKQAGITIGSNSHIGLVLGGRADRGLVRRGITRVTELIAADVNVVAAQDDVDDPFYPFGKPDQLEVAQYMAHVAHLTLEAGFERVFDMVTVNAAKAMRLEGYGIASGCRADLVLLEATSVHEALQFALPRRFVMYGGRLVAESSLETKRHDMKSNSGDIELTRKELPRLPPISERRR